jgi:predicted dehydrogenase
METIRWGLIGCGDIAAKRVAPALTAVTNSSLDSVARAHGELAAAFANQFGAKKWYAHWTDLVLDPEIDAVYIATPVAFHAPQTIAAARAGKHVLCEKPMALTVRECEKMIRACRQNGVELGIAYYRHYYPVIDRIAEILAAGVMGAPVLVQMNAFSHFDPAPDHPRRWIIEKKLSGGGPLKDFGCHRIEVLTRLFGPVRRVTGQTANLRFRRDVEDTALAAIHFVSGVLAQLTVTHAVGEPADTLDIYCANGSLHVPSLNKGHLAIIDERGKTDEEHAPDANLHFPLVAAFVNSLIERTPFAVNGEAGLAVERIIAQVYRGCNFKNTRGKDQSVWIKWRRIIRKKNQG